MTRARIVRGLLPAAAVVCPPGASAHAPIEGMEGFWLGVRHPLTEAPSCLALLALAFALAWAGWRPFRSAMVAYAAGLLLGLVLAWLTGLIGLAAPLLVLAAACAAHGASHQPAAPRGPALLLPALAAATGFWLAPAQLPEPGPAGDVLVTLTGGLLTLVLTPVVILGWVDVLVAADRPSWVLVVPRVLAGWLLALAVLLLALEFAA
ncbi:MAG: hypothetical protein V2J24_00375 [Pseudomonadales bacterium]|jgi:hypothetical protein|nr:hypothetical protein [Pseudomonadales bacterium]